MNKDLFKWTNIQMNICLQKKLFDIYFEKIEISIKILSLTGAGKILPARKPHPFPHTAPWNRTSSNVSPQVFPTITTPKVVARFFVIHCLSKSFLVKMLFFFRPRRILNFCRQVNTLVCKLSSKEALLEVLAQVFLPKKWKFAKKKLLNFLIASTIFFQHKVLLRAE